MRYIKETISFAGGPQFFIQLRRGDPFWHPHVYRITFGTDVRKVGRQGKLLILSPNGRWIQVFSALFQEPQLFVDVVNRLKNILSRQLLVRQW